MTSVSTDVVTGVMSTFSSASNAWVVYVRVSTKRQGRSGLGLEAQKAAIDAFLDRRPVDKVFATYVEIESGRSDARPKLNAAIAECKLRGARLLVAKLDRLSRDLAFVSALMKQGAPFTVADMPHADEFRLGLEAVIAQEEALKISQRTKAALAAAKVRGVKLGGFRGRTISTTAQQNGRSVQAASARERAYAIQPVIEALRREGVHTYAAIADALTLAGYTAPKGGKWDGTQVRRVDLYLRAVRNEDRTGSLM